MKEIDIESWKRKEHFHFFYRMDYPQYNICMDIDISHFLAYTKQQQLPFYYAMIYAVTDVLNKTEEFRYRIRDGKVVLHNQVHPSFTDMDSDSSDELFKIVTVNHEGNIHAFTHAAREASRYQKSYFDLSKVAGRDDLIYITCIPWISFTHLSHTITLNRNDSVPRISWRKYYQQDDKIFLPFSVQVHHALADGIHVGKYVNELQKYLNCLILK